MIKLICVGKIKDKHINALIDDYIEKIKHFDNFKLIETDHCVIKDENNQSLINNGKKQEGQQILKYIDSDDYVVLLDLHGKLYDSLQVVNWIDKANMNYKGKLCFVIAGSYGYNESVIQRSNDRWCLSNATFLHTMVRLLVVEQIYRGFMIKNKRNYHK